MRLFFCLLLISLQLSLQAKKAEVPFEAQHKNTLDSLKWLSDSIHSGNTLSKIRHNQTFQKLLRKVLNDPNSIHYPFDSIQHISILTGPKNQFRVYTWLIPMEEGEYDYFGFTQYQRKRNKHIKNYVYALSNTGKEKANPEFQKLDSATWWGCVYYEIVPPKKKSDKNFLLIGWDGNNWLSTKKVIEVISFNAQGVPTFGAPILKENNGTNDRPKYVTKFRMIFEYNEKVSMTCSYNTNEKRIVFDHLSPPNPRLENVKRTFAPDFTYDVLVYENRKWIHYLDQDIRNQNQIKPKRFTPKDAENRTADTLSPIYR